MSEALTIDTATLPAIMNAVPPMAVEPIDPRTRFMPVPWEMIEQGARLVASCPGLAPQFDDPANCMFISYQAARWGADPVAVATKTYFTPRKGGGLNVGFESQLVHALIETDPDLLEPLNFRFGYSDPAKQTAMFRYCTVIGRIRGASEPLVLTTPTVGQIKVKNSLLWFSDPDQQLSFYAARAWARRFRPQRLLGIYSRDEVETMTRGSETSSFFDGEDAEFTGIPYDGTVTATASDGPPDTSDSRPDDMDDIKAWAMREQVRILALEDPKAVAAQGTDMTNDKRFARLWTYERAVADAIKSAIKDRIAELGRK